MEQTTYIILGVTAVAAIGIGAYYLMNNSSNSASQSSSDQSQTIPQQSSPSEQQQLATPSGSDQAIAALQQQMQQFMSLAQQKLTQTPIAINVKGDTGSSNSTPAMVKTVANYTAPTFNIQGVSIPAQLNAALNTQQGNFVVGQVLSSPITTGNGTKVPAGAVFIGGGGFELNGNYFY